MKCLFLSTIILSNLFFLPSMSHAPLYKTIMSLDEQLLDAIQFHKINKVVSLLIQGANANAIHPSGQTALMVAARHGYADCAHVLINNGAWIDAQTSNGTTALMIAVRYVKWDVVTLLLKRSANINIQDDQGNTAFMQATFIGAPKPSTAMVRLLLNPAYNAQLTITNNNGDNILTLATATGLIYLVRVVLNIIVLHHDIQLLNQRNKEGNTPLMIAIYNWYKDIVSCLLAYGVDIEKGNACGDSPLMLSVRAGNRGIMYKFLLQGVNVNHANKKGNTALMIAAQRGDDISVEKLLHHGADGTMVNNRGETAAILAQRSGFTDIVNIIECPDIGPCSTYCLPTLKDF